MKAISTNIAPVVSFFIAAWVIILIPFAIIGYGFLPPDDAFRHAAKVISDKDWSQILVLREGVTMDSHPGWHAVLGAVRWLTGWDGHSLILFSVISLFLLFLLVPLFFLKRPEAWLASLAVLSFVSPTAFSRFLLGRPYIFTMASLLVICFLWPKLKEPKSSLKAAITLTVIIAASTWIHCGWYLYALPIAALLLARQWRAGLVFGLSAVAGVLIGAALTGRPIAFLEQTILHAAFAFGNNEAEYMLVSEFRPAFADANLAMAMALILGWQALRGRWNKGIVDNPVFILAVLGFVLGLASRRFWIDWGAPAALVWMAQQFDEYLVSGIDGFSRRRLGLTLVLSSALFISVTADVGSRYTSCKPRDYLSAEKPGLAEWLPGPGGIIYSDDMGVFYRTFFMNPRADWRYILGFEPTLMPKEDLEIYRNIQQNPWTYVPYEAWVKKMRPEDRLIIRGNSANPPKIPELEWNYAALGTWIGRLPKLAPKSAK